MLISDVNNMGQWVAAQQANKVYFIIATVQLWSSTIKSQKMKRLPNTHMPQSERSISCETVECLTWSTFSRI